MKTKLEESLTKIWTKEIHPMFNKGFVIYERQVQALFFHHLCRYQPLIHTWVEPVIYKSDSSRLKIIPDLVFTGEGKILGVAEIKFKPWEFFSSKKDIQKLQNFESFKDENGRIQLGMKPVSSNWNKQKVDGKKLDYELPSDFLRIFISFEKSNGNSFNIRQDYPDKLRNFLHLKGGMEKTGEVKFEVDRIGEIG